MLSHLAWTMVLMTAPLGQPGQASPESNFASDRQLPEPFYESQPETGGLFIFGGSRWGGGWKFADGSAITGCWDRSARVPEFTYRKTIYDTEYTRASVTFGTRIGLVHEWYLGWGIASRLDVSCSRSPVQLELDWFPVETVALTIGFDPLHGRWSWFWSFIM